MGVTVRDMDADMKFWSGRMGLDVLPQLHPTNQLIPNDFLRERRPSLITKPGAEV